MKYSMKYFFHARLHTQQQPFTLVHEHKAWHVTFPGYRCELDIHGSRIEAQAIARCYYSLFLAPGAPFAYADMSECEMLDLAEEEGLPRAPSVGCPTQTPPLPPQCLVFL